MCLNQPNTILKGKVKQQGASLVLALFVIVVMLLLATTLIRMLASGEQALAYEVIGTRAFNAANAGVEQNLSQVFPLGSGESLTCEGTNTNATVDGSTHNSTSTLDLSGADGFQNCSVEVSCADFKQNNVTYYRITSTAECRVDNGSVTSRTVEVEARSL